MRGEEQEVVANHLQQGSFSRQKNPKPFWCGSIFFTLLSGLLYFLLIKPSFLSNRIIWDAWGYVEHSWQIEKQLNFYNPLRTYGYALFLFLARQVAVMINLVPWISFVFFIQFVLHTATSFLAVAILRILATQIGQKPSNPRTLLCFFLVQLNFYLLPLCFEILTDSSSTFLLTATTYFLVSRGSYRHLLVGLTSGALIITRPYYGPFFLVMIFLFGISWFLSQKKRGSTSLENVFQVLIPLIILVGFQFYLNFKYEGRLSLAGTSAGSARGLHLRLGPISYKYETLGKHSGTPVVIYFDEKLRDKIVMRDSNSSAGWVLLKNWISVVRVIFIKIVGLFQSFEWGLYRTNSQTSFSNPVFLFGFLNFFLFGCCLTHLLSFNLREFKSHESRTAYLVSLGVIIHVGLYAFLTVPETRFNAPILPVTCALGLLAVQRMNRKNLAVTLLCCLVLYSYSFIVLTRSGKNISTGSVLSKTEILSPH